MLHNMARNKNANKSPQINTFDQTRKQMLWGNQEIKYFSKCLIFQEWIKSNIFFVNDLINEKGEIAENVIYNKIINKSNWISQINEIKVALPNSWKFILKSENH